jgi:hypothetical protein
MKQYEEKQALGRKLTVPIFTYSLPYRYNLIYLEKIQNLAREKGVRVVFLYLPFWKGPAQPIHSSMLTPAGRILHPVDILADPSIWQNEEHLNVFGARRISEWVAKELAHD